MAPPQRGYETTAKRKCSCARHTETKQDLSPEQDHSRSESARSTSWAECRNKKGSAPSRRRGFSLDIPFYRTSPVTALIRTWRPQSSVFKVSSPSEIQHSTDYKHEHHECPN